MYPQLSFDTMQPPVTVDYVDLERYAGEWFEIARYPNRFQKNCLGSKATYTLRADGMFNVLNQCHDASSPGRIRSARGKAWSVDRRTNAKLKVSFFWPFAGDYWIIDLDPEYNYAVIGHPKRKYLWILHRTCEMDEQTYREILARLTDQGYDITKLIKTATPQQERYP